MFDHTLGPISSRADKVSKQSQARVPVSSGLDYCRDEIVRRSASLSPKVRALTILNSEAEL